MNSCTRSFFKLANVFQFQLCVHLKSGSEPLDSWDAPDRSILDGRRGEWPDFPLDCLGTPWREWVERAAAGAGGTAPHVAVPTLGIASSLVGMACRVKASSSWLEPM